jgi:methionyl-tRNA formyltransferase
MRIVFMGTPGFAVPSLTRLYEAGHEIAAVVTAVDKPKGRGLELSQSAVKKFALEKNLIVLQPRNLKSQQFLDILSTLSPELIVIVAFRVLPAAVFTMPVHGSVNLHASLLPKYRGAAPINRAIMNGDAETGVTTFFLQEKVDTGNIILQEKIKIGEDDNAGTIHDKLSEVGAELLLKTVEQIESGRVEIIQQTDSLATPAPKIFKEDCIINWNQPSKIIHDHIRGLSPYPGAMSNLNSKVFKIYSSMLTDVSNTKSPGTIAIIDKKLYVNTADKLLELVTVQMEGKKRMSSADFIAGHSQFNGQQFST